jgi:hypothetical protein
MVKFVPSPIFFIVTKFRTKFPATTKACLLAATTLSMAAIAPAQAAPMCVLAPGGNSTTGLTVGDLKQAGFSCVIGDKTYSDFGSFVGFADSDTANITQSSAPNFLNHTLNINQGNTPWSTGNYGFNYSVAVTGSTNTLAGYSASTTSSIFLPTPTGTLTVNASAASTPAGLASANVNGGLGVEMYSASNITSDTFALNLNVTGGQVETVTTTLIQQQNIPPATVPGPLPVLGAGAAFAFSRRLRNRIKQFS